MQSNNNDIMSQFLPSQSLQLINSQAKPSAKPFVPLFSNQKKTTIGQFFNQIKKAEITSNPPKKIQEKFDQIQKDPHFHYRDVSEVPTPYRSIFNRYPNFNKVQSKVLDDVLYTNNPIVLSSPTGSGKTVVFELAIVRALLQASKAEHWKIKIVYMAPLKALCSERLNDWKVKFQPFNLKCLEVTGDSDVDDYSSIKTANLIFTTPEKWDSVTRKWKEHVSQMEHILLFLVDEIHMVGDTERGSTIEAVISRMKCVKEVTRSALRFIAVSATIPNPEDFASWLSSSDNDCVCFNLDESYRPVPLQKIVLSYGNCIQSTAFKFDLNLNYKLHNVIERYSSKCPTIVFCSTRKSTVQAAVTLQSQKRFVFNENTRHQIKERVTNVVDCKLREVLVSGIGYHHAGLSQADRRVVEELFLAGLLPVICATSTLAMGINLPAHLVIVKSTIHYAGGKFREYSPADVLQMIGRAGRPQFDSTAVAVIMTQDSTKKRYMDLVGGSQVIESNFHLNLTDHLNSEIVLKTLTNIEIAIKWMTSLFLFVRIPKNPTRYGLPHNATQKQIRDFLQNAVMTGINSLKELNFISFDVNGFISPSESGSLMARYCITFNTMKMFSAIKGDESLNDLLNLMAQAHEFSDVQLRVQEKRCLNLLNKNKNGPQVRYQYKDRIKTNVMKISVLLQSVLGCIQISDFALNQEAIRIVQVAARLSKCLLEFQSYIPSFNSYVSCLLLMKCMNCKLWENSKFVTRQFKNVGPMLGGLLANAGIVNLAKVIQTDPRELEMITNKHPPFGTELVDQASRIPQFNLFVQQIGDLDTNRATLQVFIRPRHETEITTNTSTSLVIGTPENVLIFRRKLKDKFVTDAQPFQCEINVYRTVENQAVVFWLISHSFIGCDIKSKFSPKFKPDPKFSNTNGANVPMVKEKQSILKQKDCKTIQNHESKMEHKLMDSSRIIVSKNADRNPNIQNKSISIDSIIKPLDTKDDSDFDDLPDIDWKIQEIIEPPPVSVSTGLKDAVRSTTVKQSDKFDEFDDIPDKAVDSIMREMEDSGYFDEFGPPGSFDFGVDDLLDEPNKLTKPIPQAPKANPVINPVPHIRQQVYPTIQVPPVTPTIQVPPVRPTDQVQPNRPICPEPQPAPTCASFPLVDLGQNSNFDKTTPPVQKEELSTGKVIRVDENGDRFRECGHKCADKTSCSHFCCRFGVKVKVPKRDQKFSDNLPVKRRKSEFFDTQSGPGPVQSKTNMYILKNAAKKQSEIPGPRLPDTIYNNIHEHQTHQEPVNISHHYNPPDPRPREYQGHSYNPPVYSGARSFNPPDHSAQDINYQANHSIPTQPIPVPVGNLKKKYLSSISETKNQESNNPPFKSTQPPKAKFKVNTSFYNNVSNSQSSNSFSSIFDGIF